MTIVPDGVSINMLSIGTAVLVKDVMDQHLRTIGDIRTYYASNLRFALDAYSDKQLDLIFCELSFAGGTAQEFIRKIGGFDITDSAYFVLATTEKMEEARALQEELCVDAILQEPFTTRDIEEQIALAVDKKTKKRDNWIEDILDAKLAAKNKRMQEATSLFQTLVKTYSENEEVLLQTAAFYLENRKLEEASSVLESIMNRNPFSLRALALKSDLLLKQGEISDAIDALEHLQEKSPLNTNRANKLVYAYRLKCLERLRHTQDLTDHNALVNLNVIRIYTALGKYSETIKSYEKHRDSLFGEEKQEAELYVALAKKIGGLT